MKFREFIVEDRDYMARGATHKIPFELPVEVLNVLNKVQPNHRTEVLKWIMTEGLRQSILSRKNLAAQIKKDYGFDLDQDGVFNPRAYEELGVPPEVQDDIKKMWFRNPDGEPNRIRFRDYSKRAKTNTNGYNLAAINKKLESEGKKPLHFGGPDGLIEYIEGGAWREGESKDKDLHNSSRFDKQGHDLSLPTEGPSANKDVFASTGKDIPSYAYKFGLAGGFYSSFDSTIWGKWIKQSARFSEKKLLELLDKKDKGEPLSPEEEELFNHVNPKRGKVKTHLQGLHGIETRTNTIPEDCPKCKGQKGDEECELCHGTGMTTSPFAKWKDAESYVKAKASVKAYLKWLMSGDAVDANGKLIKSAIDPTSPISRDFSVAGKRVPGINNPSTKFGDKWWSEEEAVNQMMTNIFPDDSKQLMALAMYHEIPGKGDEKGRDKQRISTNQMLSNDKEKQNQALNWFTKKHGNIDVDYNGQKVSIVPQDIINFRKDKDVLSHRAVLAKPQVPQTQTPVDYGSYTNMLQQKGYVKKELKEKNPDPNREIWEIPNTFNHEVLLKRPQGWVVNREGKWEEQPPHSGNWVQVHHPSEFGDEADVEGTPIIRGIPFKPNTLKGIKQRFAPPPQYGVDPKDTEHNKEIEDFEQNWDKLGVTDQAARTHVWNQINNMAFRYGDIAKKDKYLKLLSKEELDPASLEGLKQEPYGGLIRFVPDGTPASKDKEPFLGYMENGKLYKKNDNSPNLEPNQAAEVYKVIRDEVFRKRKKVEVLSDNSGNLYKIGPEAVYFPEQIVEAIKEMGRRWRRNQEAAYLNSREGKDEKRALAGTGHGGKESEDMPDAMDNVASNDDSDDEFIGGDEFDAEDEKIRGRGERDKEDFSHLKGSVWDTSGDNKWQAIGRKDADEFSTPYDEPEPISFDKNAPELPSDFVQKDRTPRGKSGPKQTPFADLLPKTLKTPKEKTPQRTPKKTAPFSDLFSVAPKAPKAAPQVAAKAVPPQAPAVAAKAVPPTAPATQAAKRRFHAGLFDDLFSLAGKAPAPQVAAKATPPVKAPSPHGGFGGLFERHGFENLFTKFSETGAVYDPKVLVKNGSGFNWWGAVGAPGGVSITGDIPVKKGKRGRKR